MSLPPQGIFLGKFFMAKILQFGASSSDLDEMIDAFEAAYNKIDELFSQIQAIEESCSNLQVVYDQHLRLYAKRVGALNIPVKYLEHSTKLKIDVETGEISYDEESSS